MNELEKPIKGKNQKTEPMHEWVYQSIMGESGLSFKDLSNWIKVNPYVALYIENRAIEFLNQGKL